MKPSAWADRRGFSDSIVKHPRRHFEPAGRANARPMTGSAKQSNPECIRGNRLDCFRLRSLSFGGHVVASLLAMTIDTRLRIPATEIRPSDSSSMSLPSRRAQGMPGVLRTRSLVCRMKEAYEHSHHRFAEITPALPAQWLYGCSVISPVSRAFLPPSPAGSSPANLTPASGCQDHTA